MSPQLAKEKPERQLTLAHLDSKEWWHWGVALTVLLFVTLGIAALSLPTLERDYAEQRDLDVSVSSLFGLVLLFDVYAVYQQLVITRLRRQLTKQVAMTATLELLKAPDAATLEGRARPRRFPRYYFDHRISVVLVVKNRPVVISGRTNDISEGGVGAVLPESLSPGTDVKVQLILDPGDIKLLIPAVVRYSRGFHHGIEFQELSPAQAEYIRRVCAGATRVPDLREGVQATKSDS